MSKRHFERLAQVVRQWKQPHAVRLDLAKHLAVMCREFNEAFNRERFFQACAVKEES